MDELAKKLSIISFCIIGVIVIIGVLQQRSWLEMFTIGGTPAILLFKEDD
jgi:P-type Ca2+ transporter type 2C